MILACGSHIEAATRSQDSTDFREGLIDIGDMVHHQNGNHRIETVLFEGYLSGIDNLELDVPAAFAEFRCASRTIPGEKSDNVTSQV